MTTALLVLVALSLTPGAAVVGCRGPARPPSMVLRRERAAGVRPELLAFLDWWDAHGTFPVTIGEHGGLRTDAAVQLGLYLRGATSARSLADTPHGRGAALDLYRVARWTATGAVLATANDDAQAFSAIGTAAKARGLAWGGDWLARPDAPHIEIPGWRQLPFPPAGVS